MVGLALITFGALLLLNTTGVVSPWIWLELFHYWPVLLILVGVRIILSDRAPLALAGTTALILAGTVVAAHFTMAPPRGDGPALTTYETPTLDTKELRLGMEFGGGSVTLGADPHETLTLLSADFYQRPAWVIQERQGSSADIYLSSEDSAAGDEGGSL